MGEVLKINVAVSSLNYKAAIKREPLSLVSYSLRANRNTAFSEGSVVQKNQYIDSSWLAESRWPVDPPRKVSPLQGLLFLKARQVKFLLQDGAMLFSDETQ